MNAPASLLQVAPMAVLPRSDDENGLIFQTADPIFASDQSLRIVLWNKGAEALLGFTASEVLGTPCHQLVGCRSAGAGASCGGRCLELMRSGRGEVVPTFDREICKKSGEKVWVNVTTILAASRGGLTVFVHLLRDLTRQKEIEELLRQVVSGAAKLSFRPAATGGEAANLAPAIVTAREREVIRLLAQGSSTETIAARLSITHRTARNHIQNILSKLGVHSRLEAVAYATSRGLL